MKNFKEWMAEQPGQMPSEQKWKATKEEIIAFWRNLRPDTPIQMAPIRYDHKGTTYSEDGIRITGSQQFITSVLPRLKEFLNFENSNTKLQLVYRETESPSLAFTDNKKSYVFYLQMKDRGGDKAKIPQLPEPK